MSQVRNKAFTGGQLDANTRNATENFLVHQEQSPKGISVRIIAVKYTYEIVPASIPPKQYYPTGQDLPPGFDPEFHGDPSDDR